MLHDVLVDVSVRKDIGKSEEAAHVLIEQDLWRMILEKPRCCVVAPDSANVLDQHQCLLDFPVPQTIGDHFDFLLQTLPLVNERCLMASVFPLPVRTQPVV